MAILVPYSILPVVSESSLLCPACCPVPGSGAASGSASAPATQPADNFTSDLWGVAVRHCTCHALHVRQLRGTTARRAASCCRGARRRRRLPRCRPAQLAAPAVQNSCAFQPKHSGGGPFPNNDETGPQICCHCIRPVPLKHSPSCPASMLSLSTPALTAAIHTYTPSIRKHVRCKLLAAGWLGTNLLC